MGRFLVIGRAGSGKSAVAQELSERGIKAFDTDDITGLSSWVNRSTGEQIQIQNNSYVDLDTYGWFWRPDLIAELITQNTDMFLCGGAENDLDFVNDFDKTFVLRASPQIQTMRLKTRTNNDYGQDPRMTERIMHDSKVHFQRARSLGAIVIDADLPVRAVVDEIIGSIHDN